MINYLFILSFLGGQISKTFYTQPFLVWSQGSSCPHMPPLWNFFLSDVHPCSLELAFKYHLNISQTLHSGELQLKQNQIITQGSVIPVLKFIFPILSPPQEVFLKHSLFYYCVPFLFLHCVDFSYHQTIPNLPISLCMQLS